MIGVEAGEVDNAAGYAYGPESPIEFVARVPNPRAGAEGKGPNSFASARLAGEVARLLTDDPEADLDQLRQHLAFT